MTESFYDLLDVEDDATVEDIELAYRAAIKEVHPDVSDSLNASDRTARLNKARAVLTDEVERARYDRVGHESYVGSNAESSGSAGRDGHAGSGAGGATDQSGRDGTARGPERERTGARTETGTGQRADRHPGERAERRRRADERTKSRQRRADGERQRRADGERQRRADGEWSPSGAATGGATQSVSARRQAAASATPGPNVDHSWNAWDRTRAWAVRQDTGARRGFQPERFVPDREVRVLVVSVFLLYPAFVVGATLPAFPLLVRLLVAVCSVLTVTYLLSMPEVAILVFGIWSVLVPIAILVLPGVSALSLLAVVGLLATWLPLGFAVLTYSALHHV